MKREKERVWRRGEKEGRRRGERGIMKDSEKYIGIHRKKKNRYRET